MTISIASHLQASPAGRNRHLCMYFPSGMFRVPPLRLVLRARDWGIRVAAAAPDTSIASSRTRGHAASRLARPGLVRTGPPCPRSRRRVRRPAPWARVAQVGDKNAALGGSVLDTGTDVMRIGGDGVVRHAHGPLPGHSRSPLTDTPVPPAPPSGTHPPARPRRETRAGGCGFARAVRRRARGGRGFGARSRGRAGAA